MKPAQVHLKPQAAKGLGPKSRVQKRVFLAKTAELMAAVRRAGK